MANAYVAGNLIRISSVFTDINAVVQDPTNVKVTWATDGGASITWTYGVNGVGRSYRGRRGSCPPRPSPAQPAGTTNG